MANGTVSGLISEFKGPMTVSTRETLSKENVLSPSSSRNHDPEPFKKTASPPTVAVRSKSETTRYCSPSSDPSASSSESSVSKNQPKTYKTVKQLMVDSEEESEDEEHGTFSSNRKIRTMDARIYRAILKKTNTDCHEESSRMDRSAQEKDAGPSRLYSNIVETSGSFSKMITTRSPLLQTNWGSKRIRRISLSDVQRDQRKLINNVDQPPSSKSEGEKLSTRNKEGKSEDPVESTQGNGVETEKIRKQQRSLHLLLKPEIAKLCEILLLPDNVKIMVENCLEYTMNNYQICAEPVSILQAFQLSLCCTAASLLKHKLDFEASLILAKQHLNFDCKKEMVNEINSRLLDLREKFLFLKGNSNVIGSPKASESSNRVNSYTEVTPEVELTKKDNSKNLKDIQKRDELLGMLLQMQQKEKQKLKEDIENEKAEFERKYKIEPAAIQSFSPHEVIRKEKLEVFKSEYYKRIGELESQHQIRLKDLEAKQSEARRKFLESGAPDELLNMVALKEHGTDVKYLQTHDQAQPHNAPKALVSDHVAEGKSFQNIVESMTRTGTGIGSSEAPDTNSSLDVLCSGQVELETSLVKHAGANEMEIMASKDESVSRNKCNNIAENEYDSQGNIISKHSNSREQCSDGATGKTDEGEGCENCCRESYNDRWQDTETLVFQSNGEICDGETSDVPSGEVVLVCGFSVEVKSNGYSGGVNNMASLSSQSPKEPILSVNTMCLPNCENAAQIHEADNSNGSNNADIMNSPLSDKRISSWNSKSPQEHVHIVNVMFMTNCGDSAQIHEDDDSNGSNNVVTLNSPLIDGEIDDGTIVSVLDSETHVVMPAADDFTLSMEQISGGAVNVSVLDRELLRPCGTSSPSNSPNAANSIILLNQPYLEKQNPDGVSSSIPAGPIPVEVPKTSHEGAAVSVLDREAAGGMPGTFNCTDCPENVSPLNSSSTNQISDGGSVLDGVLSSRPCGASTPSSGPNAANSIILLNQPSLEKQNPDGVSSSIPAGQIPVEVAETSHEGATVSVLDREATGGMPGTFNCADYPENVSPLNLSSTNQVSDGGSVLDGVLSSRPSGASSPSNGPATISPLNPPSLQQQIPDRVLLSIPYGQIPVIVPENSHEVAECQLTDSAMVDKSTTSDQQEGVRGTLTENNLLQETPVPRPVDLMDPLEQVLPSSSVQSPPDQDTYREMYNSFLSSPIDVPDNQSNHVSVVMEPPEQVDQLPSAGFLSSNQGQSNLPLVTGIEDQPTNEDALSSHIPEASIEVQNQAVEQPASNPNLDSLMPGGVRTESSETRNLSTPTEINSHLIPTATQSASRIVPPLDPDPLQLELEKIHILTEQNMKNHEDKKLRMKSDFEKECEELRRKYEIKRKDIEVELQKTRKNLDTQRKTVCRNKIMAEAFRSHCMDLKAYGASGIQQDANARFSQQLTQLSRQQNATRSSAVANPSSSGRPAASLQSSYATTSSQTMVPPIQSTYNTSGSVSARPRHINSISSPSINLQTGGEIRAPAPHLQRYRPSTSISGGDIRAPAPHLQPYRPSTSVPSGQVRARAPHLQPYRPSTSVQPYRPPTSVQAPSHCTVPHGIPRQPAPGIPVNSPLFTPQLPQLRPRTFQSYQLHGHWPESTGGLPTPNFSAVDALSLFGINPPNVPSSMSDLPSLNPSQFGTGGSMRANSAHQATSSDFVYLSDDD